jgi:hypothetical protein
VCHSNLVQPCQLHLCAQKRGHTHPCPCPCPCSQPRLAPTTDASTTVVPCVEQKSWSHVTEADPRDLGATGGCERSGCEAINFCPTMYCKNQVLIDVKGQRSSMHACMHACNAMHACEQVVSECASWHRVGVLVHARWVVAPMWERTRSRGTLCPTQTHVL